MNFLFCIFVFILLHPTGGLVKGFIVPAGATEYLRDNYFSPTSYKGLGKTFSSPSPFGEGWREAVPFPGRVRERL
jgi:hypothetical protein